DANAAVAAGDQCDLAGQIEQIHVDAFPKYIVGAAIPANRPSRKSKSINRVQGSPLPAGGSF
ncbi:MAG TPA: hypothetical protein PK808_07995, partial [Polymorphobacter sp.]|nr:hypothetical protein [Polymorphobacter sp.]